MTYKITDECIVVELANLSVQTTQSVREKQSMWLTPISAANVLVPMNLPSASKSAQ